MTGINIKVRFGATGASIIRVRRVTTKDGMNEIDETDSESGGYGDCDDNGVAQCDVTFEGWVRRADSGPPVVGDLYSSVLIAWDGNIAAPNPDFSHFIPKLKIFDVERTGEIRGGSISYNLTCKSSGIYYPMGVPGGRSARAFRNGQPRKRPTVVPNQFAEPPAPEEPNGADAKVEAAAAV